MIPGRFTKRLNGHPTMDLHAQAVSSLTSELGESPLWLPETREVAWLDILTRQLHRFNPETQQTRTTQLRGEVTAIGLATGEAFIAAVQGGFGWVHPDNGGVRPLGERLVTHRLGRMNDGKVGPDGAFWAGSKLPAYASTQGGLWRLTSSGSVRQVLSAATISNGLDWAPSEPTVAFYIDSATGGIDRLTLDPEGAIETRTRLIEIDPKSGEPDGLTIDAQGDLWVAIWGGGQVRHYDATGTLLDTVRVEARQSSSCCLGGEDGRTLFITSAREGLSDPGPADGRLFACRVDAEAQAPRRFLLGH